MSATTTTVPAQLAALIANLKQQGATIELFVKACDDDSTGGRTGGRARRVMTTVNEVIREVDDLVEIFSRPVSPDVIANLSTDRPPNMNEIFGDGIESRSEDEFIALVDDAVTKMRNLAQDRMNHVRECMRGRREMLEGKDTTVNIVDLQYALQGGNAEALGNVADAFKALATSVKEALGLVVAQGFIDAMMATPPEKPPVCIFPPMPQEPTTPELGIDPPLFTIPTPVDDYVPAPHDPNAPVYKAPAVEIDPPLITIPTPVSVDESKLAQPPAKPVNWCGTTAPGVDPLADLDTTGGDLVATGEAPTNVGDNLVATGEAPTNVGGDLTAAVQPPVEQTVNEQG